MYSFGDFYSFNEPEPEGRPAQQARYPKPFQPTLWLPGRTGILLQKEPRSLVRRQLPFAPSRIKPYWAKNMRLCICPTVNGSVSKSILGSSPQLLNLVTNKRVVASTSDDPVTVTAQRYGLGFDFGNEVTEFTDSLGDLNNQKYVGMVWTGVIGNDTEGRSRTCSRALMTGTSLGCRLLCGAGNNLANFQLYSSVTYNSMSYTTAGPARKEGVMLWQFEDSVSGLTLESWSDGVRYVNISGGSSNVTSPTILSFSSAAITSQMTRYIYLYAEWLGRHFSAIDLQNLTTDPSILFELI